MIKMIAGIYGYRINGRVEAKTSKSAPFKCDPKEEARLVKAGVAVYTEETEKTVAPETHKVAKEITEMNFNELKALASEKGITVKGNSKQAFIDALLKKLPTEESVDDSIVEECPEEENAPVFGGNTVVK